MHLNKFFLPILLIYFHSNHLLLNIHYYIELIQMDIFLYILFFKNKIDYDTFFFKFKKNLQ
jgi:hypothetical protein